MDTAEVAPASERVTFAEVRYVACLPKQALYALKGVQYLLVTVFQTDVQFLCSNMVRLVVPGQVKLTVVLVAAKWELGARQHHGLLFLAVRNCRAVRVPGGDRPSGITPPNVGLLHSV